MQLEINKLPSDVRPYKVLTWDKIKFKSTDISDDFGSSNNKQNGWPEELMKIAWRMVKTCLAEDGIGLAAPQIGIFKRIIICRSFKGDGWTYSFSPAYDLYINPSFEPILSEGKSTDMEYCLSVPNKGYQIVRWKAIKATWMEFDKSGKLFEVTKKIQGFPAKLLQHETDHTFGISIPQRWELQNKKTVKTKRKRKK